ncbi:hypothetical protein Plhal304r1_c007g0027411 [Plasmopara halstedii]
MRLSRGVKYSLNHLREVTAVLEREIPTNKVYAIFTLHLHKAVPILVLKSVSIDLPDDTS